MYILFYAIMRSSLYIFSGVYYFTVVNRFLEQNFNPFPVVLNTLPAMLYRKNKSETCVIMTAFYPPYVLIGNQSAAINKADCGCALRYRRYRGIRIADSIMTIRMLSRANEFEGNSSVIRCIFRSLLLVKIHRIE